VGNRFAVPTLGEHRNGHDAADVLAELAGLADRVQHLAHQVFVSATDIAKRQNCGKMKM
jgi:hypothetical protein